MKKILCALFLMISSLSYAEWKGNYHNADLVVLYKVLDPLIVEVDKPSKIILPAVKGTYLYSSYSQTKKQLEVRVTASYNKGNDILDDILRTVYKKVHFKLQDEGDFTLTLDKGTETIQGKGYFVDDSASAPASAKKTQISKDFSSNVDPDKNKFSASTKIDAQFTIGKDNQPMGVYKGTLRLDVWFSSGI